MTVITSISRNARRSSSVQEADEYEGLWLNPGIFDNNEENPKFLRFNLGVPIGDLKTRKLYKSMDPDFAAEQQLVNERVEAIKERALELAEGELVIVNIPVAIYRRQEEANVAPPSKTAKADIRKELFG